MAHELRHNYPNGYSFRAREGLNKDGEECIFVAWWKENGQLAHQELWVFKPEAAAVFKMLAAFAEQLDGSTSAATTTASLANGVAK